MDQAQPKLEIALRSLTRRVLWLGAIILIILAIALIWTGIVTYSIRGDGLISATTLGLGVNFLTGGVGAALFEILITRPQEEQRPAIATRTDLVDVRNAVDDNGRALALLTSNFAEVSGFVRLHAKAIPLEQANVSEIFATRANAVDAMLEAVHAFDAPEVRIMGMTLSDFVGAPHGSVWEVLQKYITGATPLPEGSDSLSVKVLTSDPKSLGAHLLELPDSSVRPSERSLTDEESRSQLEVDFDRISARLRFLIDDGHARGGTANLEFRICRELPPAFVFAVGQTVFVQPALLYKYRELQQPELPVLKYQRGSTIGAAIAAQFDVLWNHASAPPDKLLEGKPVRVAGGAARTGVVELYTNAGSASAQLERLLRSAHSRILLQGISHIPIVHGNLSDAFIEAANRDNVTIQVMLLDPRSEVAMQKSFARYQSLRDPSAALGWASYRANEPSHNGPHESSEIYDNIRTSLSWFMRKSREINNLMPGKVSVRLCSSVDAFICVADDCVLFEPYHFGDEHNVAFPSQTPVQLAGNMPLLEFHRPHPDPFPHRRGFNVSSPLEVCVSHFERVFEQFSLEVPTDFITW